MYEVAIEMILQNEGGYANSSKDIGGETYRGISRRYHPDWEGWIVIDKEKGKADFPGVLYTNGILKKMVRNFYIRYLTKPNIELIPERELRFFLYDMYVLMGKVAVKLFQESLNVSACATIVEVDGVIGNETVTNYIAMKNLENWTIELFMSCLLGYLMHSSTAKHHFEGWEKRIFNNWDKLYGSKQ